MFISGKCSETQCSSAALVREAFVCIKRLEKLLKRKTQNNKINNWSIELSSYKLETHYIKGTEVYWVTVCQDL